jgi:general stress protein 26
MKPNSNILHLQIPLEYSDSRLKLLGFIQDKSNELMVLSTSANNFVMSRNVLIANDDLDIYFFTWAHSRKCSQLKINPRVSLCKDKVEIEGITNFIGSMFSTETAHILNLFMEKEAESVSQWKNKLDMVFFCIKPQFARIDGYYENSDLFNEYIDLVNHISYKEKWASI